MKKNKYCIVDIVIPNYNKAHYLNDCINSVINQTLKNWRLFIIDDCSSDNSLKILDKFKRNKKIKIIKLRKNSGPGNARNIGIKLSKSKYLAFLDSDDLWKKNKLKRQISFMENSNISLSYTDYISFFENKKKIVKTNLIKKINYKTFLNNSSMNTSTMIIKRKIIKNLRFYSNEHIEDYIFKCELLKKGHIAYKSPEHSAYYRIIKDSRSGKKIKNIFQLWRANKRFNNLSFFQNIKSILLISINSLKKYGMK